MSKLFALFGGWFPASRRLRIYLTVSAAAPLLVLYGVTSASRAALWVVLAGQVLGNGMAAINASNARRWLYGIASAAAALVVAYGAASEAEVAVWLMVVAAALGTAGTGVAAAYTTPAR